MPARQAGSGRNSGSADAGGAEARTQVEHRLGVDLRHAALGDAEHLADLGKRETLVVVEGQDQLSRSGRRLISARMMSRSSRSSIAATGDSIPTDGLASGS